MRRRTARLRGGAQGSKCGFVRGEAQGEAAPGGRQCQTTPSLVPTAPHWCAALVRPCAMHWLRLPPGHCHPALPATRRQGPTNGHDSLYILSERQVVALDHPQYPHTEEPHSGAEQHMPHREGDREGEAGEGEEPCRRQVRDPKRMGAGTGRADGARRAMRQHRPAQLPSWRTDVGGPPARPPAYPPVTYTY